MNDVNVQEGAIRLIPIESLMNHPKNVRKTYTNIDELADSIRTRGVMQNLTVVPAPGHEETRDLFYVVIGNRRLQAAKQAGLSAVPCSIAWDMPEREQVSIMVTENMQRQDLSLIEQAESFQLMLDLGETINTIHEKTGLSETTVRHRLKLAELGVDHILKRRKQEETSEAKGGRFFQLNIKDYEYLEKVEDLTARRKILAEAESSENLRWKVNDQVRRDTQEKELKKFGELMRAMGIVRDTKKGPWTSKYEQARNFRIDSGLPDAVNLPKKYQGKEKDMYWCEQYGTVYIMAPEHKAKHKETAEEKALKEKEKNRKTLTKALKAMGSETAAFVLDVCSGSIRPPEKPDAMKDILWNLLARRHSNGGTIQLGIQLIAAFLEKETRYWRMNDESCAKAAELPVWQQMLIAAAWAYDENTFTNLCNWDTTYNAEAAENVKDWIRYLNVLGFSFTEQEYNDILAGTHELYMPNKE